MKRKILSTLLVTASLLLARAGEAPVHTPLGFGFAEPEQAVSALREALEGKDLNRLRVIFGPGIEGLVNPEPVEATNEFNNVANALAESHHLIKAGQNRMMVEYGTDKTLFPVPLIKVEERWFFDADAGREEVINRRIGRNELEILEVLRTCVQAQREYAIVDRDEDEVLEYAQKFESTPGRKDGLYWPPSLDGTISPLGPLVAEAAAAGYTKAAGKERQPFFGYYLKILTRQGSHAPGGAYDYVINSNMIGGFAFVAWPAAYGETGVMTFIVNQQGRVYQKDLGPKTHKLAEAIKSYDPDKSWSLSKD